MTTDSSQQPTVTDARPEEPGPSAVSWGALPVVLAGIFMPILDFFIVNVAIPSIQHSLNAGPAALQFTIAGHGLAYAAVLITGGRMGDLYGRRRIFVVGMVLFTLSSAACAIAPSSGVLVAARVVQGVAAGLMTPQVLGILATLYTAPADRARAFKVYGLALGLAGALGQLIGGVLIWASPANLGWRAIFIINIPIGIVALALTPRLVPKSFGERRGGLDLVGMVLVTAGLVAIVLPLTVGREHGWPLWTWLCLVASIPVLAIFAAYQRSLSARGRTPLIDLAMFRDRAFSVGVSVTLIFFLAMGSFFLVLALYLQAGRGLSPLGSGLVFTAVGIGFFTSSMVARQLAARLRQQILAAGCLGLAVGYGLVALAAAGTGLTGPVLWTLPGLLIAGFGMGMVVAPLSALVLAAVEPRYAAAASGVLSTAQEAGGAFGIAFVGLVFYGTIGNVGHPSEYPRAMELSLALLAGFAIVVIGLVQLLPKPGARRG